MKKVIAITLALASTTALANPTTNTDVAPSKTTEIKQATAFTSMGLIGLAAGGPIGMFVGALSGAYMGEQIKKADGMESLELAKANTENQLQVTNRELASRNLELAQLEQATLENLQLQVLFLTGSDGLTPPGEQQVLALANFLLQNPHLQIHLTGHSDPRGTDEYNDILSHERALTIQAALQQAGIANKRISVSAHGSAHSKATRGNLDSYAFDRRVDIEILKAEDNNLAVAH
jgi:outer membrane protein OmpA-like peptidoglycan-associated protein